MLTKRRKLEVKSLGDKATPGSFEAYVSMFGTVDSVGDVVVKGAFAEDIAEKGGVFPVVWTHQWGTVPIGKTTSAEETDEGLLVKGELLVGSHEIADQVYAAFKAGVPLDFSFAYDVLDSAPAQKDGQDVLELRKLAVHEVGPTLIGAHRGTHLTGVKSDGPVDVLAALADLAVKQAELAELIKSQDLGAVLAAHIKSSTAQPSSDPDAGSSTADDDRKGAPLNPAAYVRRRGYLATPVPTDA